MVAIKLLLLTILTCVCVSNGIILPLIRELEGAEREAAIERLHTGLHYVYLAGGPEFRVLKVRKIFQDRRTGYPVDIYDVDLVGRNISKCEVRISLAGKRIRIVCNENLEIRAKYEPTVGPLN
ncbi:uncharacterized protein LOC133838481 isoform X1 [Drosophila sulfurigaster albostrigata]|uniref:uncharacterized protein LOC133838481 isoform X1 n=1 Tax=Drosophila sulfurigaster albostrigata TaxID=89887 RepID=UPI002D21DB3B|nr:uncharacterized protein LOC133838481 isoform X1 [Drosophila sulfurigaster albostrigata]